jgi:hypothetical protein
MFGHPPDVALIVWYQLKQNNLIPDHGMLPHFLWTLMYSKAYTQKGRQ